MMPLQFFLPQILVPIPLRRRRRRRQLHCKHSTLPHKIQKMDGTSATRRHQYRMDLYPNRYQSPTNRPQWTRCLFKCSELCAISFQRVIQQVWRQDTSDMLGTASLPIPLDPPRWSFRLRLSSSPSVSAPRRRLQWRLLLIG